MGRVLAIAMIVVLALSFTGCTKRDEYEVIEHTKNQVPNFQGAGTHTEVNLCEIISVAKTTTGNS